MRILFAIPNYSKSPNDIRMVNRCVKSIYKHEPLCEQDVWIFDDGSPYFDKAAFMTHRVLRREKNAGYAATVNEAIRHARNYRYDIVVTVNSDVELIQPILNRACTVFNFNKKVAVCGGMLLYPNGKIQSAGFGIEKNGAPIEYNKCEDVIYGNESANEPRYVMGVTGALQFIRVSAVQDIGYYDENFGISYEDVEFCFRTWNKGYMCFYDPHMKAIHAESATRGYFVGQRELSSLNHWLKIFKGYKNYPKVVAKIERANQQAQQLISFHKTRAAQAQAKLHDYPNESDEKS